MLSKLLEVGWNIHRNHLLKQEQKNEKALMDQGEINQIEDDEERERAQRAENARVSADLAKMTPEGRAALRDIAGFGGM